MLVEGKMVRIISLENPMVQAWLIAESINCRIIQNLLDNLYLVLKTEQLDSFLLYLENLGDDSDFINSFHDISYNNILKVENKSDAVSANFLSEETVGIYNLDEADQLLIDERSLGIYEVTIEKIYSNSIIDKYINGQNLYLTIPLQQICICMCHGQK